MGGLAPKSTCQRNPGLGFCSSRTPLPNSQMKKLRLKGQHELPKAAQQPRGSDGCEPLSCAPEDLCPPVLPNLSWGRTLMCTS